MTWKIEFSRLAEKNMADLPPAIWRRIDAYLRDRVAAQNPRRLGQALQGTLKGHWRYRVGDYRIIARLDDEVVTILIIRIGHRKDVYE